MIKQSPKQNAKQKSPRKQIKIDDWNLFLVLQDHKLIICCDSLQKDYRLQLELTQVPEQLQVFCQNLGEIVQLIQNNETVMIKQNNLILGCSFGKLKKQIKLQLNLIKLSTEACLQNTLKLLGLQKLKVVASNLQSNKWKMEYQKQKRHSLQEEKIISDFRKKYTICTKWTCQVLIPVDKIRFTAHAGPICCERCTY